MSKEQVAFIKQYKLKKRLILLGQILIVILFFISWELLSKYNIINPFIFSSPSKVFNTILGLYKDHNLFNHIWVSVYETLIAFGIGLFISLIISILLYLYNGFYKLVDPFLTILNSLPKVALGPMIIIVAGANIRSVIVMAILINVIVTTIVITNGFYNTDKVKLKLMHSFGANKYQILRYLVIPNSYNNIISSFKLGISMSMIGVISGEFLVSQAGLGYLIIYGTQVFNLNIVMSGIVILVIMSFLLYGLIHFFEKRIVSKN